MDSINVLQNFQEINIESPVDIIIRQIRGLILSGQLNPGDRLPSERKLAEKFKLSRGNVRIALQKLEFYGILKTLPQSGTVVAGMGITAFEGIVSDMLKIEDNDFASLVETRVVLEAKAARLAALRRTDEDIAAIKEAMLAHAANAKTGQADEEDLLFHIKIAEASKNNVLKSLMIIITPDIIKSFIHLNVCENGRSVNSIDEHQIILDAIIAQDPIAAEKAMKDHLNDVLEFSKKNNP